MRTKIYILGLACFLLITCSEKGGSPTGPTDFASIKPNIEYFTATPSAIKLGEKSTLSWKVTNAKSVEIDGGIGSVGASGSIEVSPIETTNYTLTAENRDEYEPLYQTYGVASGGYATKVCAVEVEK